MTTDRVTNLLDIALAIARAVDLVSPVLTNHHLRVAYIADCIAEELALGDGERDQVTLAAILHDIGGLSLAERLGALGFEADAVEHHCELGYRLLKQFEPLAIAAETVRWHHTYWKDGEGQHVDGQPVPMASHVVHLADRVSVLLAAVKNPVAQAQMVKEKIREHTGDMFAPDLVDAFEKASDPERFWLDLNSPSLDGLLAVRTGLVTMRLTADDFVGLTKLFSQLVDFRSAFTATHSAGVAAVAGALAGLLGFTADERWTMTIAGHLHDLGKLAIPAEILEKPGKLTRDEFSLMKSHTYHTFRVLERLRGLETVNAWASFHHERLDGRGYPFRHGREILELGSCIMAVADVFTALAEDRPYRAGMGLGKALSIIENMGGSGALDLQVIDAIRANAEDVDGTRREAQRAARVEYGQFYEGLEPWQRPSQEMNAAQA